MLLREGADQGVDLRITGYQFPDAEDPGRRFSWHMLEGQAWSPEGAWQFRYAALSCDETPKVSAWLRQAATSGVRQPLRFTEPNLAFSVIARDADSVTLTIELDIEFLPPWRKPKEGPIFAGDPYAIVLQLSPNVLLTAADEWDAESAPYPDGLAEGIE